MVTPRPWERVDDAIVARIQTNMGDAALVGVTEEDQVAIAQVPWKHMLRGLTVAAAVRGR